MSKARGEYLVRGADKFLSGSLYVCAKALQQAERRNVGANVTRYDGTVVAYYDQSERKVRPCQGAGDYEIEILDEVGSLLD
jgi:hypothetical protein